MVCCMEVSCLCWLIAKEKRNMSNGQCPKPLLAGWWFGTFSIFPYIGNNHPNWLTFFRGVQTTNQLWIYVPHPFWGTTISANPPFLVPPSESMLFTTSPRAAARNAARKSSKPRPSNKTSSRTEMSLGGGVHRALRCRNIGKRRMCEFGSSILAEIHMSSETRLRQHLFLQSLHPGGRLRVAWEARRNGRPLGMTWPVCYWSHGPYGLAQGKIYRKP